MSIPLPIMSIWLRRLFLLALCTALLAGLVMPIAWSHEAISGSGLKNDGSWVHYTKERRTEAADQGIRVDDLPGRPMNIYIRNVNDIRLGNERRYTSEGQWGWFATSWQIPLGTRFYVSAKKDPDYWWGQKTWSGVIHY